MLSGEKKLSTTGRSKSAFAMYAMIFRLLLSKPSIDKSVSSKDEEDEEFEKLVLPSNEQWRQKVYYNLVELQRNVDGEAKKKKLMETDEANDIFKWQWDPRGKLAVVFSRKHQSPHHCQIVERDVPNWTMNDILLAAQVLEKKQSVIYENEAEMKRVLSLVYDVLRYKPILSQALDGVNFFHQYPELKTREKIVLLLFYDMQARKPVALNRISKEAERQASLSKSGLSDIEKALVKSKTSLNASLARLRIHGHALKFDDLLPQHLRAPCQAPTSGWVNTMKVPTQREFINEMSKLGLSVCTECNINALSENHYNFDPLCPKVVNFHRSAKEKLAVSDLVRNYGFIFLDRSLCFGAAALYHAIRVEKFFGPVILTHAVAPRHAAYMSNLLADIDHAGRLHVFGAGDKKAVYQHYLHNVGITPQQCQIYSESYVDSTPSPELDRATVVLATPPCSYSGVDDIVDLVIAKGGNIDLLESLTASDILVEPEQLAADQLSTLKYALQKPNVQLLIYEVHSVLPGETTKVVEEAVQYANKMATEKYIKLHTSHKKRKKEVKQDDSEESDVEPPEMQIPDTDVFETAAISDIYKDEKINGLINEGCFLSVLKRKEMVQFDSIFMIKFAESKGLFGSANKENDNKRLSVLQEPAKSRKKSVKIQNVNLDRITSDTQSTAVKKRKKSEPCPKKSRRMSRDKTAISTQVLEVKKLDAKRWWMESTNYILSMPRAQNVRFRILRTDPVTKKLLCPMSTLRSVVVEQNDTVTAVIS